MEDLKESTLIDIDPSSLEVSLKRELQSTQTWEVFEPFILSRLPYIIREKNKELYEPHVVSIGPYHRDKESLLAMEANKPRCLIDFLNRNSGVRLEDYVKEIRALEERARKCYSETIIMNKDEFAKMLLLDGCFILEFFFKVRESEPHVLLDVGWGTKSIISDLLLFENQIPFFVIKKLFSIVTSHKGDRDTLLNLLHPSSISPDLPARRKIYHLLHLYYQWFIPDQNSQSNSALSSISTSSRSISNISPSESPRPEINLLTWLKSTRSKPSSFKPYKPRILSIPCATELDEAGITFKRKINPRHVFDITFENGVLEIPTLPIDLVRRVLYINLAAFERSSCSMENNLMSYVTLMDSLINSNKDVLILQRCEIISNMLLNEEDQAIFFNQLGDWSMLDSDKHYFSSLFRDIRRYCDSRWPKYRAKLKHDYFNSPWSVLSVLAAILLFILSGIQTVYQVYPVVHHHN